MAGTATIRNAFSWAATVCILQGEIALICATAMVEELPTSTIRSFLQALKIRSRIFAEKQATKANQLNKGFITHLETAEKDYMVQTALSLPFGRRFQPVYEYREYIPPSQWPTEISVAGSYPFMHRPSDDMIRPEPFMSEFVNGFATGSERIKFMKGSLNIPSLRHNAIWDLTGQLRLGPSLTHFNWQNDVLRQNPLHLSPAAQNVLENDPAFDQGFESLGRSAYSGYTGCTSAFCKNPGAGFDGAMVMQPPKNLYLNGKLDFPLFTGTYGDGYRFDRHFDIFAGRHPTSVTIGHHTNPFVKAMLRE